MIHIWTRIHVWTLWFLSRGHSGHTNLVTRTSVLADALKTITNAEKAGKRQVLIRPASKVIIRFLQVIQKHGKYTNRVNNWIVNPSGTTVSRSFNRSKITLVGAYLGLSSPACFHQDIYFSTVLT